MVPGAAPKLAFECESGLYFVNRSFRCANFVQAIAVPYSQNVLQMSIGTLGLDKSSFVLPVL